MLSIKTKNKCILLVLVCIIGIGLLTYNSEKLGSSFCKIESTKTSAITRGPIVIDDSGAGFPPMSYTWAEAVLEEWCSGSGTVNSPYIIEDLKINANGNTYCLIIRNSNAYFIIQQCEFSGVYGAAWYTSALYVEETSNGRISENNCSDNHGSGIGLFENCLSFVISGNILNNDSKSGILIVDSSNINVNGNTITDCNKGISCINCLDVTIKSNVANINYDGISISINNYAHIIQNTANNNYARGIVIGESSYSNVSKNVFNNNNVGIELQSSNINDIKQNQVHNNHIGLYLDDSNNNSIMNNALSGNEQCIKEVNCQGNIYLNNDCGGTSIPGTSIPGYSMFFLMIISFSFGFIIIICNHKFNKLPKKKYYFF